jgi:pimeloyl-ACP methyl ester carboxylesterase
MAAAFELNGPADEEYLETLRSTGYQLSDERSAAPIDAITTVIAGRRDRVCGYRDQFDLISASTTADYVLLDDIGHYFPFEQPERLRTLMLDWLARCHPDDAR